MFEFLIQNKIIVFQNFASLITAAIIVWFSVWLSLGRFRKERLWETKLKSYSELLVTLHNIKRDVEISIPAHLEHRDTNTEFYKKWREKTPIAWDEIKKQIDVGELLLSREALVSLREFNLATVDNYNFSYLDHLESIEVAVGRCIEEFKSAAMADLKIPVLR